MALGALGVVVALIAAAVVIFVVKPGQSTALPGPTSPSGPTSRVSCVNDPTRDTAALSTAIGAAPSGGVVQVAAGTCALNAHLPIRRSMTVEGAGQNATFLVQHAATNIFQITAPGVTIQDINLNTATYNPGPAIRKAPKPSVLFSNQSHTTIRNVTAEAGTGFGMRITGPSPCSSYQTTDTVVQNVNVTNAGRGGFTALDIDCTNGAQLSNITVHGDYIAFFQDENVTLNGETYTPDAKTCQAPWYITGPAANITIDHVTGGGHGIITGTATGINATNQTVASGC
jgi:hypothetical protein